MRAEYFPMYGSFTNKHFCSSPYIFNLSENILSINFLKNSVKQWRGYPIFTNVLCREFIFDIKLAQFVQILF